MRLLRIFGILWIVFFIYVGYSILNGGLPWDPPWLKLENAVKENDIDKVTDALKAGANINQQTNYAESKHSSFFILFHRTHKQHNNAGMDMTPLMIAVSKGYYGMADFLILKGASPCVKNDTGETPLTLLSKKGDAPDQLRKELSGCRTYIYQPGYGIQK